MASITHRRAKDGTLHYRVRVRLKGQPLQTATFERISDAKLWAKQTEAAIIEGRYFKTSKARRHTVGELVERYCSEVLAARAARSRELVTQQLRWWAERIGELSLAEVTPAKITQLRDELARGGGSKGRRISAATQNRYLQALSHAFAVACREWEWIKENPVRKVRRLKEPRGRVRFLSDDERQRLLKACQESLDPRLYPLALVAIATGARQGELLALKWADIDFDRGLAVVHETKNGERRALPLAGSALAELRRHRERSDSGGDLVFGNERGEAKFLRRPWEEALVRAEIHDFRFHDLRHTAASYLAMSGATLAEIAEILGHKTLAMVKRYSHLSDSHAHMVVARMNEKYL